MDIFEQRSVLSSFEVLHDSREQDTERARRRYASLGVPHDKAILDYGDYTYNVTLPDGSKLFDTSDRIYPLCVIERKMHLGELSQCLAQGRERFQREFERAAAHGATIYLVIENASWEDLIRGRYNTQFNPKAFFASLIAFTVRYNCKPIMCQAGTSGQIIKEILYRDLKERLERGEFDERLDKAAEGNS